MTSYGNLFFSSGLNFQFSLITSLTDENVPPYICFSPAAQQ